MKDPKKYLKQYAALEEAAKTEIIEILSNEPAQKVVGDSRYKEFELADGNYSLYYFWNNKSLHNFIDMNKLNVNIIEYKNY